MFFRRILVSAITLVLVAGVVAADTKIVKSSHTDAFAIMGQEQPAKDEESVMWVGKDRMRMDQGGMTFIVRLDQGKMYLIDDVSKTYNELDLPIDLSKLMPAEMAAQMMQAMNLEATVTPTDETKKVGSWNARRYDVALTSAMMQMSLQVWATKDVDLDLAAYRDMEDEVVRMQPGMANILEEMRKVEGFQVASEGSMTVMGSQVNIKEQTQSVEEADPPAGAYDPPAGFTKETYDFMKAMQQK